MGVKSWTDLANDLAGLAKPVAGAETVSLRGAVGRILAEPAVASLPLPARTHAVMDGYALGAVPPGQYRILAAGQEQLELAQACPIAAGDAVPRGTICVVLADRAVAQGSQLTVRQPEKKDNIRRVGEELAAGDSVLLSGLRLDARHTALAAAVGLAALSVRRKPRIAVLTLHDGPSSLPHLAVFDALLRCEGLELTTATAVRSGQLARHLQDLARRNDLIVVVAESLGGEDGVLAAAIHDAGGEAMIRRAALKPAKPIITGLLQGVPVLGLAGTAYATCVAAHLFLRPMLHRLAGHTAAEVLLPAVAAFSRTREPGRAEALPVRLRRQGQQLSLSSAGRFGQLSALAAMDGFALVAAEAGDIAPGIPLLFHPLLTPLV